MKILALRFKNLNSLYGEWFIDFSAPEYMVNGIFAMAGPTGAGKSTILDAICLALYGATPRLGKITSSGNEIMSRQTGECYAEVTFASQAGTFRCHWGQHKAHKKADGNLLDARHEIADAASGRILESKKRNVAGVIEEKTGMDFDRFTRSILLAQGGFDSFLKADVEQKSKILEQITGTEIYTEISRKVHERQREEREKLNLLQAESAGIAILNEPQEAEINRVLSEMQLSEKVTTTKVKETGQAIAWLSGIHTLQGEITLLSKEMEALAVAIEAFQPERKKLMLAQKAAELDGIYAALISTRKQQEDDRISLKEDESKLPKTEALVSQKEELLKSAELVTAKAKEKYKTLKPLIQKVRMLDQQISDRKKLIDAREADCKRVADQINAARETRDRKKGQQETARNKLAIVQTYLSGNAPDETLVAQFAGIEEQINSLRSVMQDISEKKESLVSAERQLKSAAKTVVARIEESAVHQKVYEGVLSQVSQKKKELGTLLGGRLLREYRTEKESLLHEMVFLRKIADLESERRRLEDGKPCPLCGSEKHPYAEGNVPEMDETEKKIDELAVLIRKAELLEVHIKKLETMEKDASVCVVATEKMATEALHEEQNAGKHVMHITGELVKVTERFSQLKTIVLNRLQPFGIQEMPEDDAALLLSSLKERLKRWQAQSKKKEEIEKQHYELHREIETLDAVMENHFRSLTETQNSQTVLKAEYESRVAERGGLFGQKNPDTEEVLLEKAVSEAEQVEKQARAERDQARQLLREGIVRIASFKERILKRTPELEALESDFLQFLKHAGFPQEQSFIAGRLPASERDRLLAQAKALDDKKAEIQTRKKDREDQLFLELEKKITGSTLDDLKPAYNNFEEELQQIRDDISGLKHKLIDNNLAKEKISEKKLLIDTQKNECLRWEKLHSLIGSADGKKYRNFAQGLTFELMVSHANRQLVKMTDRYLLIRDSEQPLELNAVDSYQAGETRSTRNLSGGESFIVSLSLALGLSQMASRKVRVDSLFLDEGFGTLDEEMLETALETLAGLHQDGKLIGIISHVTALKERISTQIDIIPVSGGKSLITGPGCRQLSL